MTTPSGASRVRESAHSTRNAPTQNTPHMHLGQRSRRLPDQQKISNFIKAKAPQTPFLVIDLAVIDHNYRILTSKMKMADVYYAVKANPEPEILRLLVERGSSFDVASPAEIEMVLTAGASPTQISYGNTIKKERDIALAYEKGIRLFAFDSEAELLKLSRVAPGAQVFCRILTTCDGAEWPLSRKFGCEPDMAHDLLLKAKVLGLIPYGISFHVGSQQTRTDQWNIALSQAAGLFTSLKKERVSLSMVNIGGGLPANYSDDVPSVDAYSSAITMAIKTSFGNTLPRIIIEPGRSLVGNSGIIESEVVLVSKKSYQDEARWVYLDIGKFSGLAETHDEAIKYRIESLGRKGATGPVILAGPSCDSVDILYEIFKYQLPMTLAEGDRVRIHSTGAYTSTYSSVGFNGFAPLPTYCIE